MSASDDFFKKIGKKKANPDDSGNESDDSDDGWGGPKKKQVSIPSNTPLSPAITFPEVLMQVLTKFGYEKYLSDDLMIQLEYLVKDKDVKSRQTALSGLQTRLFDRLSSSDASHKAFSTAKINFFLENSEEIEIFKQICFAVERSAFVDDVKKTIESKSHILLSAAHRFYINCWIDKELLLNKNPDEASKAHAYLRLNLDRLLFLEKQISKVPTEDFLLFVGKYKKIEEDVLKNWAIDRAEQTVQFISTEIALLRGKLTKNRDILTPYARGKAGMAGRREKNAKHAISELDKCEQALIELEKRLVQIKAKVVKGLIIPPPVVLAPPPIAMPLAPALAQQQQQPVVFRAPPLPAPPLPAGMMFPLVPVPVPQLQQQPMPPVAPAPIGQQQQQPAPAVVQPPPVAMPPMPIMQVPQQPVQQPPLQQAVPAAQQHAPVVPPPLQQQAVPPVQPAVQQQQPAALAVQAPLPQPGVQQNNAALPPIVQVPPPQQPPVGFMPNNPAVAHQPAVLNPVAAAIQSARDKGRRR